MPDQPTPNPKMDPPLGPPGKPVDPSIYGGQWGDGDKQKAPGPPPADRPDKIETPSPKS